MASLTRRVERLEGIRGRCGACEERGRRFHVEGDEIPATCPECGRPVEVLTFTIAIDRASGRGGGAA